ncbi:MAG: DUF309 domain-containing protein [Cyanobacteria bacterium P01_C01_bin.120]
MSFDLPPAAAQQFQLGLQQFNQGEYYACHDTMEDLWMEAEFAEKPFFQGILQFSVALYHLGNHNWQGTAILLGEGIGRLEPFEPIYHGIDVSHLLDCASDWLALVQQLGPQQVVLLATALTQIQQGQPGPGATATLPQWQIKLRDAASSPDGLP